MGGIKPWHILILVLVVLLLFGAGKLPSLARNVGKSMRIFKSEVDELRGDEKPEDEDDDPRRRPVAKDDRAAGRSAEETSRDRAYDPSDQADRVPVRDEDSYRRD
ncbi:Sec-independent protein translocase subunit TatA [Brachybacterium sp. AOP25-B2-12]|uniref:Sec-independent protein translocase subunit TatA n=1 Tax=Brachybacterium sp. AOP25-B2-12 TaxID=3457710 RepID=UPI00403351A2